MTSGTGPLAGVRVVDFTWVGAGPIATKLLADFGADVIKIESSTRPDPLRYTPPLAASGRHLERSGYFSNRNSSKRSIELDLGQEAGRDVAARLIGVSDVVANSFTPGTMARWGFDYAGVRRLNESIVYLEMPMLGATGPHASFAGFGSTLAALSGFFDLCGYPDRPPVGTGTNYPDHVPNPMHAVVALMAALIHRDRTGEGQCIELSQLESTINVIGGALVSASQGEDVRRTGNRTPWFAPEGVYRCTGEDRWCAISVRGEERWRALCEAMDRRDLFDDPRFSSHDARREHADELDMEIERWTATKSPDDVMVALTGVGIAAGAVRTADELVDGDVQLRHRRSFTYLDHPEMGRTLYSNPVVRLSRTPGALRSCAPLLGEHTEDVLSGVCGMTDEEIDAYRAKGAFGPSRMHLSRSEQSQES